MLNNHCHRVTAQLQLNIIIIIIIIINTLPSYTSISNAAVGNTV
jgi:hypothetical protein